MALQMRRVFSSHVMEIGYDDETAALVVRYYPTEKDPLGKVVQYDGVDPETADGVTSAPSVGTALHLQIRGKFPHRDG